MYVAQPGDYLVKIASEHGTTWQAIWNHPLNAEHRHKRQSPDTLYAGDVLHIPVPFTPEPPAPPGPPVPPPIPEIPPVPAGPPTWPYEPPPNIDLLPKKEPTWECPGGMCLCHPHGTAGETVEHVVFVHDDQARRMPGALCRAHVAGMGPPKVQVADGTGAVHLQLPEQVTGFFLEWGTATPLPGQKPFRKAYRVDLGDGSLIVERQLAHIGVSSAPTLSERVYDFQLAYRLPPYDGDAESLAPILQEYHASGRLPPLPLDDSPGPVAPLPSDIRSGSQGAVSAARQPNPARLHVQLVDPAEEPLRNIRYRLYLPLGEHIDGVTNGEGHIDEDELPVGDHRLELEHTTVFASASAYSDPTRRILVVF